MSGGQSRCCAHGVIPCLDVNSWFSLRLDNQALLETPRPDDATTGRPLVETTERSSCSGSWACCVITVLGDVVRV